MPPLPISHSTRNRPAMIWGVSILVTLSFGKEGRFGGALVLVLCGAAEKERRIRTGFRRNLTSLVFGLRGEPSSPALRLRPDRREFSTFARARKVFPTVSGVYAS